MMEQMIITLILLVMTALPALALPNNTSGPWGIDISNKSGFTNLSTAKHSPATAGKTMVITEPMNCNNLTIPADRAIEVKNGGKIRYSGNLVISGSFSAGLYQVLEKVGSGTVVFSDITEVHPEWWKTNAIPGTTDMTYALQTAIDTFPSGVALSGSYFFTGVTITRNNTHIYGGGGSKPVLYFSPPGRATVDNIAIRMYTPVAAPSYGPRWCSIKNITLDGSLSKGRKIAIKNEDTSVLAIEDVKINLFQGNGSIGLWMCGRDLTSVRNVYIHAERPIILGRNMHGEGYGYDVDVYHFENLALGASNQDGTASAYPNVEVDPEATIYSIVFDGYQSWNQGTHGFYMNHTNASDFQSNQIRIDNVRWEQGSAGGYAVYVKTAGPPINNLMVNNLWIVKNEADVNGIFLYSVTYVTLRNVNLRVGAGMNPLYIPTGGVSHLQLEQVYANTVAPLNMGTMTARFAVPHTQSKDQAGYIIGLFEQLTVSHVNSENYITVNGGKSFSITTNIPAGSAFERLPILTTDGSAVITISGKDFMATYYVTKTAVTKMYGTANTFAKTPSGAGVFVYIVPTVDTLDSQPVIQNNIDRGGRTTNISVMYN